MEEIKVERVDNKSLKVKRTCCKLMHILFHKVVLICKTIRGTVVSFVLIFNTKKEKRKSRQNDTT
jgi:hypothetical protein